MTPGKTHIRLWAAAAACLGVFLTPSAAGAACPDDPARAVVCGSHRGRAERGSATVEPVDRLADAARGHARDMVRRRYFSHVTPEGETMVGRLREAGYVGGRWYWHVGEVLAWGRGDESSAAATVDAWMRSTTHRRVLLQRDFRHVGVGVADGDPFAGGGTTFAAELGARWR